MDGVEKKSKSQPTVTMVFDEIDRIATASPLHYTYMFDIYIYIYIDIPRISLFFSCGKEIEARRNGIEKEYSCVHPIVIPVDLFLVLT